MKEIVFEPEKGGAKPLRCPVKFYEFYLLNWYVESSFWPSSFVRFVTFFLIEYREILLSFSFPNSPKSLKEKTDVFYLLPELMRAPNSPIWYSTQAMAKESLAKMLNLVKMVKEINEAIWTK